METVTLRRFQKGDEYAVSELICKTLRISNRKDYSPAFIEENVRSHSPESIAARAEEGHFYVATDRERIVGCGGITGYWGNTKESYLTSIFVLPEHQGSGVGRKIVEALEADEYFRRAWRTEVGSSPTAVHFYKKLGYEYKNGITDADKYGVVRMGKRRKWLRGG